MTEQVNVNSDSGIQNQSSPAVTQNSNVGLQSTEKLLRQSEVNELVGNAKHTSYEKGKQDAIAEYQRQSQNFQHQQVNPSSVGGIPQLTKDQIEEIKKQLEPGLRESAKNDAIQALRNEQAVHQLALKMSAGTQKHADFEKIVTALNLPAISPVLQIANGFDNTADIIYDLGKNPSKVSSFMVLASVNPNLAFAEMQKLSDSIKKNETALANEPNIREPHSQIKSSNVGAGSGKLSISELRRQPLLKA